MVKLKFELFITFADQQITLVVEDEPILLGCNSQCQIKIGDGDPEIKALIEKEGEHLNIKIFDINYPVTINGKKYKSAKIKKSAFFKIGDVDIISTIDEVDTQDTVAVSTVNDEMLPSFVDENVTSSDVIPSFLNDDISAGSDDDDIIPAVANRHDFKHAGSDGFDFNIEFEESDFRFYACPTYSSRFWDYSQYIDLKDETVKELPSAEIHQNTDAKSFHITHMNNGVVISDGYYSTNYNLIFMSDSSSKNNCVQIHDCGAKKFEFINSSSDGAKISKIGGYSLKKILHNNVIDIDNPSAELLDGQKLVLSKGTSQIFVEFSATPPKIKTNRFFNIDEELLRAVAISWIAILFFIGTAVFFPPKQENEVIKEKVVLLKRQKNIPEMQVQDVKRPEVADVKAAPAPKEVVPKKDLPPPPQKTKPIVNATPPKPAPALKKPVPVSKVVESTRSAPPKIRNIKTVQVANKPAPAPEPKKQYKFSFGKNLASKMNNIADTNLKVAKSEVSADIANAVSSSTSQSDRVSENKNFGATNTKVARFAAGGRTGASSVIGAKGLSGKSRSATAYIEANTKILGAMDPNLIRKLMREFIPEFRRCYQRELLKNSSVAGVFDLSFKINAQGKGTSVYIKSHGESFSENGKTCLTRVVSLINFPKPKGGGQVDVKQPMNFYNQ